MGKEMLCPKAPSAKIDIVRKTILVIYFFICLSTVIHIIGQKVVLMPVDITIFSNHRQVYIFGVVNCGNCKKKDLSLDGKGLTYNFNGLILKVNIHRAEPHQQVKNNSRLGVFKVLGFMLSLIEMVQIAAVKVHR